MNRGLVLQELSDDQLAMVTGGTGANLGETIIIEYITYISISNSVLINSPVNSFNGNVNSTIVYNGGNTYIGGNVSAGGGGGGSGCRHHHHNHCNW